MTDPTHRLITFGNSVIGTTLKIDLELVYMLKSLGVTPSELLPWLLKAEALTWPQQLKLFNYGLIHFDRYGGKFVDVKTKCLRGY